MKKLIITTNMHDTARMDQALLRPGRCFDAVQFRALTPREAGAAQKASGLPIDEREMTLAEMFGGTRESLTRRKVGF